MTNNEIIYSAAIDAGIYTQEQADAILASGHFLPLHTFQEWKARGYSVKKGEKAVLHVDLWKFTNKPPKAAREHAAADGRESSKTFFARQKTLQRDYHRRRFEPFLTKKQRKTHKYLHI